MADYKQALQEGFAAAEKANSARKEIEDVLAKFKSDLLEASDGKLLVEVRQYEEKEEEGSILATPTLAQLYARRLQPKKYYKAIIAVNPKSEKNSVKQLAVWGQAKGGYPCSVSFGKQEFQCENRAGLEEALAEMLKDPAIGEKLYLLAQLNGRLLSAELMTMRLSHNNCA